MARSDTIDRSAVEQTNVAKETSDYLASRLDGARSLYVLALALGKRGDESSPATSFGRMIREARIHFLGVIEEARLAGLNTLSIAVALSDTSVIATLRPDMRDQVEALLTAHGKHSR